MDKNEKKEWELLAGECRKMGIILSDLQLRQFSDYYEYLVETNRVMNLTAITSLHDVVIKHFTDSLSLVKALDLSKIETVIDMGTGAGFPGIPLKIAFPHLKVTLADSLQKRVKFLSEVISICGLEDIEAVHNRAEILGQDKEYREKYDLCVSRAVASLPSLCEYCIPLIRRDGFFVAYKSGEVQEELMKAEKAIQILGGDRPDTLLFTLPASDAGRSFIKIRKISPTPRKYPRKPGMPAKQPL